MSDKIGVKRGTILLADHDPEWEEDARQAIEVLTGIAGSVIRDIQHVGSTSVPTIKAKPIIDIMVAVDDFDDFLKFKENLASAGFYYRPKSQLDEQILFAAGSHYNGTGDMQTHFIHVVKNGSASHRNYINFRDYLIKHPTTATEYENLKLSLMKDAPIDPGREKYCAGKNNFIKHVLRKALVESFLGKTVSIEIDRPIGSVHPKHHDIIYPINYGYIPNVIGGDGEELDVYLLAVDHPVKSYTGRIIGIIHRENDVEDKLVMSPCDMMFTANQISDMVHFQEQFYTTHVQTAEASDIS